MQMVCAGGVRIEVRQVGSQAANMICVKRCATISVLGDLYPVPRRIFTFETVLITPLLGTLVWLEPLSWFTSPDLPVKPSLSTKIFPPLADPEIETLSGLFVLLCGLITL